MQRMVFFINGQQHAVGIDNLVIASWTGRDPVKIEKNIAKLQAMGIPRPSKVPSFYRVGVNLLTTDEQIDVVGADGSGEAEFVLVSLQNGLFVGVGSDHTDRKVEAYNATVSKQMCPKPISRELWPLNDVNPHWDQLVLRSWVTRNGQRELYQEGPVTTMLAPHDLISRYRNGNGILPVGTAMYCGTLPVLGEIGGGEQFELELSDELTNLRLRHGYKIRSLAYAD
jgi:hypothetical protein